MKKIIACTFSGLLSFTACESSIGMNDPEVLYSRMRESDPNTWSISQQRDKDGNTVLHIQAQRGDIKLMRTTLSFPYIMAEDINAINNYGRTALHTAAESGNVDVLNLLLSHRYININAEDNNKETPLHIAIKKRNTDIAKILLSRPEIDVNALSHFIPKPERPHHFQAETPLCLAAVWGNSEIVRLLLAHPNIDPNIVDKGGNSALYNAISIWSNRRKIFRSGANLRETDNGDNPLLCRAINDSSYEEIALMLIKDRRVNINSFYNPGKCTTYRGLNNRYAPFPMAAYYQNITLVKAFLERPDLDLCGLYLDDTAVGLALCYNNSEILDLIIKDPKYNNLQTQSKILRLMVKHKDDQQSNKELVAAVLNASSRVLNVLTDDDYGDRLALVHIAIIYDDIKVLEFLLKNPTTDLSLKCRYKLGWGDPDTNTEFSPLELVIRRISSRSSTYIPCALTKLSLFRELAPQVVPSKEELQQWTSTKYPTLVKSQVWQQVLDTLYGPQQD